MEIIRNGIGWLRRIGQNFGPYLVLELVMPGGTILALLLFLYRRGNLLRVSIPINTTRSGR